MKPILRILVIGGVLIGVAGGLIWGFLTGRSERAAEAEREAPVEAASRVTSEGGKTVLTFDEQAQRTNGITVTALASERRNAEARANGVVLQLQPLLDLKTSYNSSLMDAAKARAAATASQAECQRLQQLNQGGQNISEKAVEAARAAAESDAAVFENAQQSIIVLKSSMQFHWGAVVTNWLEKGSPQFDALLQQRDYVLQVTAVNSGKWTVPAQATVQLLNGEHISARLVSAFPEVDPRIQSPSFLYAVSTHPGLTPGMNLPVFLPTGPARSGVTVPYSAVVWWQGHAWCYVEERVGKFTREEVLTENPAPGGWFVSEGIAPGERVVAAGAQTLLSEEFRSQIQSQADEN